MAIPADNRELLTHALIARCRKEVGGAHRIDAETDPCRDLGICEEDLDDVQIEAAAAVGLRPPYRGEALVIPWQGPKMPLTIAGLATWLAANGRPLEAPRER